MRMIVTFLIGCIVQLMLFSYLSIEGVGINILLLLTIEIALVNGSYPGEIFGFISGFVEDIFIFGIIGARALIRTFIGYIAGKFKGNFEVQNLFFQFGFVFVVFMIHGYFIYLIRLIFSYSPIVLNKVLLNAVINGLFAPVVYYIVRKINAR